LNESVENERGVMNSSKMPRQVFPERGIFEFLITYRPSLLGRLTGKEVGLSKHYL